MAAHAPPVRGLGELEIAHADEGQLVDIKRSDALTTELERVDRGYFISPQLVGSVSAIALATLYVMSRSDSHDEGS